jgi:dTDP-glucose pyrophosphorylase
VLPKPLVQLAGRPFFWWAVQSIMTAMPVRELVFVVLREHVEAFRIDAAIQSCYPDARIVTIPEVTAGAAETAAIGIRCLATRGPVAVNDCDHAFDAAGVDPIVERFGGEVAGALLGFRSTSPAYSYAVVDDGRVTSTFEKKVVSPYAIAGCYLFADPERFAGEFAAYQRQCRYDELFLSGMFDMLIRGGSTVLFHELVRHVSFGTPEELERVEPRDLDFLQTRRARK